MWCNCVGVADIVVCIMLLYMISRLSLLLGVVGVCVCYADGVGVVGVVVDVVVGCICTVIG